MKLLGVINDNDIFSYLNNLDGIIMPLKDFSVDYFKYYTYQEIKEYKEKTNKLCFVVMNKMIFNYEINNLLSILKKLEQLKVDGIFFYDLSILNLVQENNLNIKLIFNATNMVVNTDTINLYNTLGVKGAYLSNEITIKEIFDIRHKTSSELFILLVGNPVVAMSKRKLLTNYFAFNNKSKKDLITIKDIKNKQQFIVKEDEYGTTFFDKKCLNLSNIYQKLQQESFDYGIIEQGFFTSLEYKEIIESFTNFNKEKIDNIVLRNRGFLYRKTIYKVK